MHKPKMFNSEITCLNSLRFFRNLVPSPPGFQTKAVRGSTPDLKVDEASGDLVFILKSIVIFWVSPCLATHSSAHCVNFLLKIHKSRQSWCIKLPQGNTIVSLRILYMKVKSPSISKSGFPTCCTHSHTMQASKSLITPVSQCTHTCWLCKSITLN